MRLEQLYKDSTIDTLILVEILETIYNNEQKKLSKILKNDDYKKIYQYIIKDTDLISGIKFLRKISKNNHDISLDLHSGNIMFRNNYPVIIDPFCATGVMPIRTDIDINDLDGVFSYVRYTNSKDPELINALLSKPQYAYFYAADVIKGRSSEVEKVIINNPFFAYLYAMNVIKGRWAEAEPFISKNPRYAYAYTKDIIKGRWPEAETFIMKDPAHAYLYAKNIIKGRWSEAEPFIMKDPEYAYNYARNIIKGRWKEAEPFIMKRHKYAYFYEKYVINGIDKNI